MIVTRIKAGRREWTLERHDDRLVVCNGVGQSFNPSVVDLNSRMVWDFPKRVPERVKLATLDEFDDARRQGTPYANDYRSSC